MSLIAKPKNNTQKPVRAKLDEEVFQELQNYQRFLEADQNHVINEALAFVFKRDKDFQTWKKKNAEQLANLDAVE